MTKYAYKARQQDGKPMSGTMEAASKDELAKRLKELGYVPTHIEQASENVVSRPQRLARTRVAAADMILFNTHLANLISAGITLLVSLRTINQLITNRNFQAVIKKVGERIADGASFSEALGEHPSVFPGLFVSMVKAGETGGNLSLVLHRYSQYVEQQDETRQKIKNALLYPALLLIFGTIVVIFIVSSVIPKFVEIFVKAGVKLPWSTQLLYDTGLFFKGNWAVLIVFLAAATVALVMFRRTKAGRGFFDAVELSMPVFGSLQRKIYFSRFSRSLATLLESGVSLLSSLDTIKALIGNSILTRAIDKAKKGVESGETLAKPLKESGIFPGDLIQMITIGEESGQLSKMLHKNADFYDKYIDHAIKRLMVVIEPVLIILMASLVGLIMASVIIPLFDMVKTIH